MKKLLLSLLVISVVGLTACKEEEGTISSSNIDAEEVLTLNPDADIFQWDGVVYKTGVDWVEELHLTMNKELGEITSLSPNPNNYRYENGMANKLTIGSKIYTSKERNDILLVESDGKIKKYLGVGEG
ncbi:hypothetical protein [Fictibacillus nanhaiensis]|uniref:hypothetical protein n=1 Tax=Fictibacillus nanhaiensis TaxID=742169 RepID=UPI001FEA4F06|nr:hypothetical protein [Fictibacillus nanhaiensis]